MFCRYLWLWYVFTNIWVIVIFHCVSKSSISSAYKHTSAIKSLCEQEAYRLFIFLFVLKKGKKNNFDCLQQVGHHSKYMAATYGSCFSCKSTRMRVCFLSQTCLAHIKLTCHMCDICPFPFPGPYFKASTPIKKKLYTITLLPRHAGLLTLHPVSFLSCMHSNKATHVLILRSHRGQFGQL